MADPSPQSPPLNIPIRRRLGHPNDADDLDPWAGMNVTPTPTANPLTPLINYDDIDIGVHEYLPRALLTHHGWRPPLQRTPNEENDPSHPPPNIPIGEIELHQCIDTRRRLVRLRENRLASIPKQWDQIDRARQNWLLEAIDRGNSLSERINNQIRSLHVRMTEAVHALVYSTSDSEKARLNDEMREIEEEINRKQENLTLATTGLVQARARLDRSVATYGARRQQMLRDASADQYVTQHDHLIQKLDRVLLNAGRPQPVFNQPPQPPRETAPARSMRASFVG